MRFFKGHGPPFRGVAYRPDGRTLITANQSGSVTLWDLDSGHELTRLASKTNPRFPTHRLEAIALSPDGRLLAAAGAALTVWELPTGEYAAGYDSAPLPPLRGAVFALNGSRLIANLYNGWQFDSRGMGLAVWDTTDGRALPMFPAAGSSGPLTTGPDAQSVFGSPNDHTVRWHLPTEREYPTQLLAPPYSLAASPVAGVVAQGVYRTVEIRDANGERLLARWDAHKKGVFALAFSTDGKLLATGSGDEMVKVWDVSGVSDVLADPDARPLATVPERSAFEWKLGPVRAIAFSPDGLTAAAVGDRVKFVVWDLD